MNTVTNNETLCQTALAGLKFVDDPEIGLNVVDLGLIYEVNFDEAQKKVVCNMTLTTQFCPMGESIVENVTQSLQESFPESGIEVNLTFDPPWGYHCISEGGREFLNR
ncbi:MAG: metal-sulfur cluster assembly factor [Chlorobi bacterium]|nr:MAG: metal-sulfur cluster assembly factor [Bacteroidota bacterium]KXK34931.1 MAG: metal-sulfur cluster biosynthetic enzyme [Chlorobi bacterium OLB6]MBE2266475.1 metal-sulfur cluster assembly factor [Flavobacteriales bacterium]MBL1161835.1 metal-sulfur cluster assembly factor [Chlorobiota bacterium]MBW7853500.1 metal-sulfur cluster assembly factor [Candidatus Kapabacteria bacterium]MCC6331577.1 metal-sulfur cluster assembly factor [Ignavibacteria bacterium]